MEKLTYKELKDILDNHNPKKEEDTLRKIQKYITTKAVLGIDIYQYSQYKTLPQSLIPHLFKTLYDWTIQNCIKHEPNIFHNYKNKQELTKSFIDTGDGGFQILENPFQAIIFAIYFQANAIRYNSKFTSLKELNNIIGDITFRFSLTYDDIYSYENNHYGSGIINCSRILSKDQLNRFLIDENSKKWFIQNLNTVENLAFLDLENEYIYFDFIKVKKDFSSILFKGENNIKSVHIMKYGDIKAKKDTLSIYNFQAQVLMRVPTEKSDFNKLAITLGNLNPLGLDKNS